MAIMYMRTLSRCKYISNILVDRAGNEFPNSNPANNALYFSADAYTKLDTHYQTALESPLSLNGFVCCH